MYIPIILATARKGRQSEKVAQYMLQQVKNYKLKTELLDVRDYRIPATDNTMTKEIAKKYAAKIKKADGLIIVSPEYNHGYPGELKMMLDMTYKSYFNKPLGICGVSSGILGGARVVEQLRLVGLAFHMVPIGEALYFLQVKDLFDKKGNIKEENYEKMAKKFLDELTWYAKHLKKGRK